MSARRRLPLLRVAEDPRLFGAVRIAGGPFRLRPRQQELMASLDLEVSDGGAVTHVWAISRQAGKSTMASLFAIHNCTMRPDLDAMMPTGALRTVAVVGKGLRTSQEIIDKARTFIDASPVLRGLVDGQPNQHEIRFRLPDGSRSRILALPCSSSAIRGFTASALILDEFAHFGEETEGPAEAAKVLQAALPTTTRFQDAARVLVISTPYGTEGKFAELFFAGQAGTRPKTRVAHFSAKEMDPHLPDEWLAERELEMGYDEFATEMLAEFVPTGGGYFGRIEPHDLGPADPSTCDRWVAGLDPAFRGDPFGIAIVGPSREQKGQLVHGFSGYVRPPKKGARVDDPREQEDRILSEVVGHLQRFGVRRAITDQHMVPLVAHHLQREGILVQRFNLTAKSQSDIFGELKARMNLGQFVPYEAGELLAEMRSVRVNMKAGQSSVKLTRGRDHHADQTSALALAVWDLRRVSSSHGGGARHGLLTPAYGPEDKPDDPGWRNSSARQRALSKDRALAAAEGGGRRGRRVRFGL